MEINVEINKQWFEKNKQLFLESYNQSDYVEKPEYDTTYKFKISDVENCENVISEREDNIRFVGGDSEKLWLDVEHKPTIQELLNLATIISKYYNKAKSAIEALK